MEKFQEAIKAMDREQLEEFALQMAKQARENKEAADTATRKMIEMTKSSILNEMIDNDALSH